MDSDRPLGFNPVGEHAAGLPAHDKPLPGHVSEPYPQLGGDDAQWNETSQGGGAPGNMGGPGMSILSGVWSSRIILVVATYLTLPIQLGLYPIAGIPAFIVGYLVFRFRLASGVGFDASMGWAWFLAWIVLLGATRFDTGFETQYPAYRTIRHVIRLVAIGAWMTYFDMTEQGDAFATALIIGLAMAAIAHFVLRSKWLRWIWDNLQMSLGLRTALPPLPV